MDLFKCHQSGPENDGSIKTIVAAEAVYIAHGNDECCCDAHVLVWFIFAVWYLSALC
jgi:hypothetical protein